MKSLSLLTTIQTHKGDDNRAASIGPITLSARWIYIFLVGLFVYEEVSTLLRRPTASSYELFPPNELRGARVFPPTYTRISDRPCKNDYVQTAWSFLGASATYNSPVKSPLWGASAPQRRNKTAYELQSVSRSKSNDGSQAHDGSSAHLDVLLVSNETGGHQRSRATKGSRTPANTKHSKKRKTKRRGNSVYAGKPTQADKTRQKPVARDRRDNKRKHGVHFLPQDAEASQADPPTTSAPESSRGTSSVEMEQLRVPTSGRFRFGEQVREAQNSKRLLHEQKLRRRGQDVEYAPTATTPPEFVRLQVSPPSGPEIAAPVYSVGTQEDEEDEGIPLFEEFDHEYPDSLNPLFKNSFTPPSSVIYPSLHLPSTVSTRFRQMNLPNGSYSTAPDPYYWSLWGFGYPGRRGRPYSASSNPYHLDTWSPSYPVALSDPFAAVVDPSGQAHAAHTHLVLAKEYTSVPVDQSSMYPVDPSNEWPLFADGPFVDPSDPNPVTHSDGSSVDRSQSASGNHFASSPGQSLYLVGPHELLKKAVQAPTFFHNLSGEDVHSAPPFHLKRTLPQDTSTQQGHLRQSYMSTDKNANCTPELLRRHGVVCFTKDRRIIFSDQHKSDDAPEPVHCCSDHNGVWNAAETLQDQHLSLLHGGTTNLERPCLRLRLKIPLSSWICKFMAHEAASPKASPQSPLARLPYGTSTGGILGRMPLSNRSARSAVNNTVACAPQQEVAQSTSAVSTGADNRVVFREERPPYGNERDHGARGSLGNTVQQRLRQVEEENEPVQQMSNVAMYDTKTFQGEHLQYCDEVDQALRTDVGESVMQQSWKPGNREGFAAKEGSAVFDGVGLYQGERLPYCDELEGNAVLDGIGLSQEEPLPYCDELEGNAVFEGVGPSKVERLPHCDEQEHAAPGDLKENMTWQRSKPGDRGEFAAEGGNVVLNETGIPQRQRLPYGEEADHVKRVDLEEKMLQQISKPDDGEKFAPEGGKVVLNDTGISQGGRLPYGEEADHVKRVDSEKMMMQGISKSETGEGFPPEGGKVVLNDTGIFQRQRLPYGEEADYVERVDLEETKMQQISKPDDGEEFAREAGNVALDDTGISQGERLPYGEEADKVKRVDLEETKMQQISRPDDGEEYAREAGNVALDDTEISQGERLSYGEEADNVKRVDLEETKMQQISRPDDGEEYAREAGNVALDDTGISQGERLPYGEEADHVKRVDLEETKMQQISKPDDGEEFAREAGNVALDDAGIVQGERLPYGEQADSVKRVDSEEMMTQGISKSETGEGFPPEGGKVVLNDTGIFQRQRLPYGEEADYVERGALEKMMQQISKPDDGEKFAREAGNVALYDTEISQGERLPYGEEADNVKRVDLEETKMQQISKPDDGEEFAREAGNVALDDAGIVQGERLPYGEDADHVKSVGLEETKMQQISKPDDGEEYAREAGNVASEDTGISQGERLPSGEEAHHEALVDLEENMLQHSSKSDDREGFVPKEETAEVEQSLWRSRREGEFEQEGGTNKVPTSEAVTTALEESGGVQKVPKQSTWRFLANGGLHEDGTWINHHVPASAPVQASETLMSTTHIPEMQPSGQMDSRVYQDRRRSDVSAKLEPSAERGIVASQKDGGSAAFKIRAHNKTSRKYQAPLYSERRGVKNEDDEVKTSDPSTAIQSETLKIKDLTTEHSLHIAGAEGYPDSDRNEVPTNEEIPAQPFWAQQLSMPEPQPLTSIPLSQIPEVVRGAEHTHWPAEGSLAGDSSALPRKVGGAETLSPDTIYLNAMSKQRSFTRIPEHSWGAPTPRLTRQPAKEVLHNQQIHSPSYPSASEGRTAESAKRLWRQMLETLVRFIKQHGELFQNTIDSI